jgi:hypothetical protein
MKINEVLYKKTSYTWSSLNEGMDLDDRMELFEELSVTNNLTETNNNDSVEQFKLLWSMSDVPERNNKYIVVPTCLMNNRVMLLDKVTVMAFVSRNQQEMTFSDNGQSKTYPSELIRERATYNVFTFATTEKYESFHTMVAMRFELSLPTIKEIETRE